ncbi:MAG: winged helix-turn-helix domain-containing protein, partial [Myxococcota bacterium]
MLRLRTCTIDLRNGAVTGGREARLTTRELLLLTTLVDRSGEVVARDELMTVFGYRSTSRSRAVDKAMASLRAKVEHDRKQPDHLLTIHGSGYRFEPSSPPLPQPPPDPALPASEVVGREAEVGEICRAIREGSPRILVGGRCGMGKTALARCVLERLTSEFEGRVTMATLDGATTLGDAWTAVASALGHDLRRGDPVTEIGRVLAQRRTRVLVVDGVAIRTKDVLDAVHLWRAGTEELCVVATSAIELPDWPARRFVVGALDFESSLALFWREAGGVLDVPEDELTQVMASLDGMPLAIEVAASRVRVLGRSGFRQLLRAANDPASNEARDPRLAACVGRSWAALGPESQRALQALGGLPRSFGLEVACHVLGAFAFASPAQVIRSLSAAGVLTHEDDRLILPVTMRGEVRTPEAMRRRVSLAAAAWASRTLGPQSAETLPSPLHRDDVELLLQGQREAIEAGSSELAIRLTLTIVSRTRTLLRRTDWIAPLTSVLHLVEGRREEANIWSFLAVAWRAAPDLGKSRTAYEHSVRAAQRWVDETNAPSAWLRLGESRTRLAWTLYDLGDDGHATEADRADRDLAIAIERANRADQPRRLRARASLLRARLASLQRRHRESLERGREALKIYRELSAPMELVETWGLLARAHRQLGEREAGLRAADACVEASDELAPIEQVNALRTAAVLRIELGHVQTAAEQLSECIRRSRALGSAAMLAQDGANLGTALLYLGRVTEARRRLDDATLDAERARNPRYEAFVYIVMGQLERTHGHLGVAERIANRAASLLSGDPLDPFETLSRVQRAE